MDDAEDTLDELVGEFPACVPTPPDLVIPFGLVGAVLGHVIRGVDLSMMSVFGVVALSGVVVNSSLVLVHYVNERRASGRDLISAVRDAGQARFRPIVLTSITTFMGLTPLLLEGSVGEGSGRLADARLLRALG